MKAEIRALKAEVAELRQQIKKDTVVKKEVVYPNYKGVVYGLSTWGTPADVTYVTLAGKVDAIMKHLGIEITVKQPQETEAQVVVKKVAARKKGAK